MLVCRFVGCLNYWRYEAGATENHQGSIFLVKLFQYCIVFEDIAYRSLKGKVGKVDKQNESKVVVQERKE